MLAWLQPQYEKVQKSMPNYNKPLPEQPLQNSQQRQLDSSQETQNADADAVWQDTDKRQKAAGQSADQKEELTVLTWNVTGTTTILD